MGRLRILCFLAVILSLTIVSGETQPGASNKEATPWIPLLLHDDVSGHIEIRRVEKSGLVIASPRYSEAGLLTGYTCYSYFEVTSGSGELQITVDLQSRTGASKGSQTSTFAVEEGKSYKISAEVKCSGPTDYNPGNPPPGFPNRFIIIFSSPSAASPKTNAVDGGFYTDSLSLEQLYLEPWEYTPPQWELEVRVDPAGSGSVSDSLGLLIYEGTRPGRGGEYYVGLYEEGTEVTLTATPASGYVFNEWYGTWGTLSDTSITFDMVVDTYWNARFIGE
jgi:hypothetical protein